MTVQARLAMVQCINLEPVWALQLGAKVGITNGQGTVSIEESDTYPEARHAN